MKKKRAEYTEKENEWYEWEHAKKKRNVNEV